MIIVTTDTIPGKKIIDVIGYVAEGTVRSKNLGKDIGACLKSLAGGEVNSYTDMQDEVVEFITKVIESGVTVLDTKGAHSQKRKKMLMCVVPTIEYLKLKELVLSNNCLFETFNMFSKEVRCFLYTGCEETYKHGGMKLISSNLQPYSFIKRATGNMSAPSIEFSWRSAKLYSGSQNPL